MRVYVSCRDRADHEAVRDLEASGRSRLPEAAVVVAGAAGTTDALKGALEELLEHATIDWLWAIGAGVAAAVDTFVSRSDHAGRLLAEVHHDIHVPLVDVVTRRCLVFPDDVPPDLAGGASLDRIYEASMNLEPALAVELGPWRLISPRTPTIPTAELALRPRLLPVVIIAGPAPIARRWGTRRGTRHAASINEACWRAHDLHPPLRSDAVVARIGWPDSAAPDAADGAAAMEQAMAAS